MNSGTLVIGSSQARYRVEQRLGVGIACEVYRAVEVASGVEVALKVLRRGVGEVIEANFWGEAQILGELANAARAVGDERCDVPQVWDTQRHGEVRFLVLELVVGQPLDRVLQEKECLAEREALFVAQKVLRVLTLLHERVRRTCMDLQLQHIWLQRDENGVLTGVKVMDWKYVSERVPDAQALPEGFGQADLARFGAYFYRMLTGKGADERGETERMLAWRAGARWEEVSLGSRQLVLRALHPNVTRRFAGASAFRQAVLAQERLWAEDGFDLLFEVRMWLKDSASSEEESESILAKLDMAARLGAPARHVAHYRAQFNARVGEVSLGWKTGERYYHVEQYREAAEKWREEAEAKGRLDLWRWVMLAEAGAQMGRRAFASVREQVEEVVDALNRGEVTQAFESFVQLEEANGALDRLEVLKNEALARINIDEAFRLEKSEELAEWEKALKGYETGQDALQRVPEPIRWLIYEAQAEWPYLWERIETLTEQIKQRCESDQAVLEVKELLAEDVERGRQRLELHLRYDPSHRPLVRLCLTEAERLLQAGQVEQAKAMLTTGVLYAQVPEHKSKLRENWLNVIEMTKMGPQLERGRFENEQSLVALKEKAEIERMNFEEEHQQKLMALQEEHQSELERLRQVQQEELERQRQALAGLQQEHQSQRQVEQEALQTRRQAHQEALQRQEQELNALNQQREQELQTQREALTALQQEHQSELQTQRQALAALQQEHQSQLERQQQALNTLRQAQQQELATLRENHFNRVKAEKEHGAANLKRQEQEQIAARQAQQEKRLIIQQLVHLKVLSEAKKEQEKRLIIQQLVHLKIVSEAKKQQQEHATLRQTQQQELDTLRQTQQQALNTLRENHFNTVKAEKEHYDKKLKELRDKFKEHLAKEEREQEADWQLLRSLHQKQLADAKAAYDKQLASLNEQQQQAIARLNSEHKREVTETTGQYQAQITALQTQHSREVASKKRQKQAALKALEDQYANTIAQRANQYQAKLSSLHSQYQGDVKRMEEQHQQTIDLLNAQHEEASAETERQLAAVRQQREAVLNAEQSEVDKLLASLRPKNDQRLIAELDKLLAEERWDDFLKVASQTPEPLLARQRTHWTAKADELNKRFQLVLNSYQIPLAQKLLSVLNLLQSDLRHKRWRQGEYDRVVQKFHQQTANWQDKIAKLVEKRRWEASSQEQYRQVVADIAQLLVFTQDKYPQLAQWLSQMHREVAAKIEKRPNVMQSQARQVARQQTSPLPQTHPLQTRVQTRQVTQLLQQQAGTHSAKRGAQAEVKEQQRVELARLMQIGFNQIGQLTPHSLWQAHGSFEQALKLMQRVENDREQAKILAGMKLIRYLDSPLGSNISIYVQRIEYLREFLSLADNRNRKKIFKWLSNAPVIKWIEEAQKYVNWAQNAWANNQKKEANRFSQGAFKLLLAIEVIIYGWWRQVRGFDERLALPALQNLKEHVQRQPFFRG